MWNDNKSCSTWACETWKCGKMMMPMMIIIVLLIVWGIFVYSNYSKVDSENISLNNEVNKVNQENKITNVISSWYKVYSPELLLVDKANILFFAATWCPSCQWADKSFMSETIPDNINLLKVDYDTYSDLKQKYSITMQHTYVQVDVDWNEIKKWSGSKNIADILKEVQ